MSGQGIVLVFSFQFCLRKSSQAVLTYPFYIQDKQKTCCCMTTSDSESILRNAFCNFGQGALEHKTRLEDDDEKFTSTLWTFWGKVQEKLQRRQITSSYDCEARSAEELKHWFKYQRHSWMNSIKQLLSTTGAFIDRVHPRMSLVLESMLWLRGAGPHFTREECTWDLGSSGIFFDSSPVHSSKMKFGGNSTVLES